MPTVSSSDELAAADEYNIRSHYLEISTDLRRSFHNGPIRVGNPSPAVTLLTLDGETVDLADFRERENVALVFGSYSAPPCTIELPAIEHLSRSLEDSHSTLLFVYTREIHPDEPVPPRGHSVSFHRSLDEKMNCARLLRDEFSLTVPVLVDSITGRVHRAFGCLPFQAAVIDRQGIIAFRAEWANAAQLGAVLANLETRDQIAVSGSVRHSYSEGLWGIDASTWH